MQTKKMYLDRIEGDVAVLIEDGDSGHEEHVAKSLLPHGITEGVWLSVRTDALGHVSYETDTNHTTEVKQKVQTLMDELAS